MLIERKPQISILTLSKIKFRAENIKKDRGIFYNDKKESIRKTG